MGQSVTAVGYPAVKEVKQELKKHAATIHCSNTLSLLQRKITNALLYHAYHELMTKEEHEITVKQLCRLIGYQGNNHGVIKEALRGLISTIIEWNIIDESTGTENWTASSIIASVSLEGSLCFYAYSPRMKQLLHSPSIFGKIDLVIQSKFRSSYGLALYENCIRYRGLPHTKWFEMDLFKKLMGVPVGKYDIFRDFKRRVLDKAVDEVNMYSDLLITAEYIREGRAVKKVRFTLKDRAKRTRLGNTASKENQPTSAETLRIKLYTTFGLSDEQVEQVLTDYPHSYIETKLAMIEESNSFQEGKVKNATAYLLSALKHNYQAAKSPNKSSAPASLMEHHVRELKNEVEVIRKDYAAYREEMIHAAIHALSAEENERFYAAFHALAAPTAQTILRVQRSKYTADNVYDAPPLKALLRQFALRELSITNLLSLEEFVAQLDTDKISAWQQLKSYDPEHVLLHFQE